MADLCHVGGDTLLEPDAHPHMIYFFVALIGISKPFRLFPFWAWALVWAFSCQQLQLNCESCFEAVL